MITRIVKLTIDPEKKDYFFDEIVPFQAKIRQQKGCSYLEFFQDINNVGVIFTYSNWDSEDDLNNYRQTELFDAAWTMAKKLFVGKPEAWSIESIKKFV
jgi:quinol monooxygenase YgiN